MLPTPRRVLAARVLAVVVDLVQIALLPVELTPLDNVLDVAAAAALVALVGWHWAFLPTFLVELVPVVDLVPTWTLAVMIATRDPLPRGPEAPPPGQAPPGGPGS